MDAAWNCQELIEHFNLWWRNIKINCRQRWAPDLKSLLRTSLRTWDFTSDFGLQGARTLNFGLQPCEIRTSPAFGCRNYKLKWSHSATASLQILSSVLLERWQNFSYVVSIFNEIITICSLSQKAHVFVQLQRQHIVQGNFFPTKCNPPRRRRSKNWKRH